MKPIIILTLVASALGAILGLDYGQQFTKAVVLAPGLHFEMVVTDEGKRKDLSAVSIRPFGHQIERFYGSQTGSLCTRFPQSCLLDVKPLVGASASDPTTAAWLEQHLGVKVIGDDSRGGAIRFDLGFKNQSYQFTVEEVLAMKLDVIKQRALNEVKNSGDSAVALVDDVTITVPPLASVYTKQSYLDALKLAGFTNVLGLVDEGTAAALNYASNRKYEKSDYNDITQYHAIFDMGAGSTKATVFSLTPFSNGTILLEIENAAVDTQVGGRQMTEAIYKLIVEDAIKNVGIEEVTPKLQAKLMEAAEKAKLILSTNSDYHVLLESLYDDRDFKTTVNRDDFEQAFAKVNGVQVDVTKALVSALEGVIPLDKLDSVVLNGGATRTPLVQRELVALVGEARISKSINTDESCAVGATQRGLQLKVKTTKKSDVVVVDRAFSEFSVRGDGVETVVFEPRSSTGQVRKLDLGELNKTAEVQLFENGEMYKSYTFTELDKKADKFKCKGKKHAIATFVLDSSKMFDLAQVDVECSSSAGFFGKLLQKDEDGVVEEDVATNKTNTTTTSSEKKQTSLPLPLPKPSYTNVTPMLRTTREKLSNKLAYLKNKDIERILVDEEKNVLEAKCYELRSYIDSNSDVLKEEIDDLESYGTYVSELLEWLDFESDDASMDDIRERSSATAEKLESLSKVVNMVDLDLSVEGLKKLKDNGSKIVDTLQKNFLKFGEHVSLLREKFEQKGFNFTKESERVRATLIRKEGFDASTAIEDSMTQLKEILSALEDVTELSEAEFAKLSKMELYEFHEKYGRIIGSILEASLNLEQQHGERLKQLGAKYDALVKRQEQKEMRQKLKEEKKKKKEEEKKKKVEEEKEEEGVEFEAEENEAEETEIPKENETEETETPKEKEDAKKDTKETVEHDEL